MAALSKEEKIYLFSEAPVGTAIIKLAIPTIISQLIIMLYNMADAFFVGRIGDPYQTAALSLAFPLSMLLVLLGNLYGIGGNVVIARALGEKKYDKVRSVSSFSFFMTLVSDLLVSILFVLFLDDVLMFIGASDKTFPFAKSYLTYILIIGAVPTGMQLTTAHLLRSEGMAKKAGTGMMLGAVINIGLDPLFILILKNGITGAAIATLISNCISLIYLLSVAFRNRASSFLSFSLKDFSLKYAKEVLKNGLQAASIVIFGSTANIVMTRTAASFNDIAVASFGIQQKYTTLSVNIATGFGQGVMPLLGFNYSAGNFQRIRDVNKTAYKFDGIFVLVFVALVELFPRVFAGFFTTHPETVTATAEFLRISFIGTISVVFMDYIAASFQAFGKWVHGILISFIKQIALYIPMIIIMSRWWGVKGLAAAYAVSQILSLIISGSMYISLLKKISLEAEAKKNTV